MFFHQRFIPGLAIYSYLVGNEKTKEAAVIDPTFDVDEFIELAGQEGLQIRHILETHVHADFVSGASELKDRLDGRPTIHCSGMGGDEWTPKYADRVVANGDEIHLGDLKLKAIHTPGHTPEHVSWALYDKTRSEEVAWLVFTGDFLFVGDVGRPDLLGVEARQQLAHQLYQSVFETLPTLPDSTEIFPAHGSGSLCGKAIGSRGSSTLGFERRFNPSLITKEEEQWTSDLLAGMPIAPPYFRHMKRVNVTGPKFLANRNRAPQPFSAREVYTQVCDACLILDVRTIEGFSTAHIAGAINIPFGPNVPTWAGWVLPYEKPILIVADDSAQVSEVIRHLLRVGFDDIRGYLEGGMETWEMSGFPVQQIETISVQQLASDLEAEVEQTLLDVRTEREWNSGHISQARHIHGGLLKDRFSEVPPNVPVTVICGSGYRGGIAASFLKREGYEQVRNVIGGMTAWQAAELPVLAG